MKKGKVLGYLERLGKAMLLPVAVLPAAGLMLRLGAADVWAWTGMLEDGIPWMKASGAAIFDNLPLIFAIGIAVGFADNNDGVAGIAAAVSFFILTNVAQTFNETINMGILGGIVAGILGGNMYNKYKTIRLPDFLAFFGGRRFVPIVSSFYSLIIGVIAGYVYPFLQNGLDIIGDGIISLGSFGTFLFGMLNRLLIPFGLHRPLDNMFWQVFGSYTDSSGQVITGDLSRFFAGDPTAGGFMTGFFPIMLFGLPAVALAMYTTAKDENKKGISGMLIGIALTSFLTGVTEPIEFTFMFLTPVLYLVHALLTGASLFVSNFLGIKSGFTFSAGFIDYVLSFGIATKPLLLLLQGAVFGVIYYFVFVFLITKLDLPTPGRLEEDTSAALTGLTDAEFQSKSIEILEALGGSENIEAIDACVTRLRVTVKESSKVNEDNLSKAGVARVLKVSDTYYQIVVGTVADVLATNIRSLM